jgi:hypothetical protein
MIMAKFYDELDDMRPEGLAAPTAEEIAERLAAENEQREANRLARVASDSLEGLPCITAGHNQVVRFALLHFVKPKFYIRKLDGEGMIHVRVVALALQYTNADPKTGSYRKGEPIEWRIGHVGLDYFDWSTVCGLSPEDSNVYDIDLLMWKKFETNIECAGYGHIEYPDIDTGFEFYLRAPKARWKHYQDVSNAVGLAARALLGR